MAGNAPFELECTHEGLDSLVKAIRSQADAKLLRKELAKNMREVLKPAAALAKSNIMGMASTGASSSSPGLRTGIAKKIRPEVKLGGRWSGARVKAFKTPGLRGFANAAKRTNRRDGGWRTLTYGHEPWRTQHGKRHWFDESFEGRDNEFRQAVLDAMNDMARRIASRVDNG